MPRGKDGQEDYPSLRVEPNALSTNDVPCRGRMLTRVKLNWREKRFLQKFVLFDHQQAIERRENIQTLHVRSTPCRLRQHEMSGKPIARKWFVFTMTRQNWLEFCVSQRARDLIQ
jgi:hypothetical protein